MDRPKTSSVALIDVTSGMQLRISAPDFTTGKMLDVGVSLKRTEAQALAHALLEYSGAWSPLKTVGKKKLTFCGTWKPNFEEVHCVKLNYSKPKR